MNVSEFPARTAIARTLLAMGLALGFAGGASAGVAGWDSTLSRPLLDAAAAAAATPVAADMPMQITLSLKVQDKAAIDELIRQQNTPGSPAYQRYLTPAQYAAQFSPTQAQADAVAQYLTRSGFQSVRVSADRLLVGGTAPASVVQKAFNTKIEQFSFKGKTVYANATAAQVPSSLGGVVLAVGGLQSAFNMTTAPKKFVSAGGASLPGPVSTLKAGNAAGAPTLVEMFTPQQFQKAYDALGTVPGSNTSVAISSYGDNVETQVLLDLRQAEKMYGLPYVPFTLRATAPIATANLDTSGDGEWSLDTQSASGIAQNLKSLIVYTDDDTVVDNLLWEYAAFADAADAKIGNMSYGLCELFEDATITSNPVVGEAFTQVYGNAAGGLPTIASSDQLFQQAVVEGLSWHASTGDSGGYCTVGNVMAAPGTGVPGGADYPTSSPYVVSVGGSNLFTDADGNYVTEIAWTSGGGGVSVLESPPSWQVGIVPSAVSTTAPGRGTPDIAMNSGTEVGQTGATVVNGAVGGYLGTSLSSPLAAGALARLQTDHCNQIGFASPAYYGLVGSTPPYTATGFHDVVVGSNSFWPALPGYDYTTGLGSIDIGNVDKALPAVAGCTPLSDTPVVTAVQTDSTGTSVTLTISGSDAADTLDYYVVDFGDGKSGNTVPDIQIQPTVAWPNPPTGTCTGAVGSCATYPTATPFTGAPNVFTHTYAKDGTYSTTVWVRNGHGTVSAPLAVNVVTGSSGTVTGGGGTTASTPTGPLFSNLNTAATPMCRYPGASVVPSTATVDNAIGFGPATPVPGWTPEGVSITEPWETAYYPDGRIEIALALDATSPAPPNTTYYVFFTTPKGTVDFVSYNTTNGATGGAISAPFVYGYQSVSSTTGGTQYNNSGNADADSYVDTTNNRIVWFLSKSKLPELEGNHLKAPRLSAVSVQITAQAGVNGLVGGLVQTVAQQPGGSTPSTYAYQEVSNGWCGPENAPTAVLAASSSSITAGDSVSFDGTGASDPDTFVPDSVSGYTLDFGDGSTPVTQATPSGFTHNYTTAGSYTASMTVKDSRGVSSSTPATQPIQVASVGGTTGGTTTGGSTGSTTGGSTGGSTGGTTGSTGGGSQTVTASLSATPTSGSTPLQVAFDASVSASSNGTPITSYTFFFGDGTPSMTSSSPTLSYTYTGAGNFDAVVVAKDANGYTATSPAVRITPTASVTVTPSDHSIAILSVTPTSGSVPLTVHFDGSRSQGANGNAVTTWTFDFGDGSAALASSSPKVDHVYTAVGSYSPTLSVTDAKGNVSPSKAMAVVKAVGSSGATTGTTASGGAGTASAGGGGGAIGGAVLLPLFGLAALRRRRRG